MGSRAAARPQHPPARGEESAAQGMWSGTVGFSLVAIPVRMVRAVEPGRVSFRLLHRVDHAPLRRRMFCPRHGKMVPPAEIVRGYELAPGVHLPVSDAELESVSPERSRTLEILQFIDPAEVDGVRWDHPYYLVPDRGGEKAYRLLVEVMRRSGRAGLARFVLGEREHLVAIRSREGALVLTTLRWSEDLLPEEGYAPRAAGPPGGAARMKAAIRRMKAPFDPGKYADRRRREILDLLKRKIREGKVVEAPESAREAEGEGSPPDLVAALREAMRQAKTKKKQR